MAQTGQWSLIEKDEEIGGTWWENAYPGCRVDNPSHLYSYSFFQRRDWPHHFSTRDVLLDYFRSFAAVHGLREHVQFETEVVAAVFSDATCRWTLELKHRHTGRSRRWC